MNSKPFASGVDSTSLLIAHLAVSPAASRYDVHNGITHKEGHKLVQVARMGGDYVRVPNPSVDLMRTSAAKQLRVKLNDANRGFMESLNRSMAGGEGYPLLTGLLSIGAGLFSAGAGIRFTIATSVAS